MVEVREEVFFNKSPQMFMLQVMVELPWTFGEGQTQELASLKPWTRSLAGSSLCPPPLGWGHHAVIH